MTLLWSEQISVKQVTAHRGMWRDNLYCPLPVFSISKESSHSSSSIGHSESENSNIYLLNHYMRLGIVQVVITMRYDAVYFGRQIQLFQKMEGTCSSKTTTPTHWTTCYHIPVNSKVQRAKRLFPHNQHSSYVTVMSDRRRTTTKITENLSVQIHLVIFNISI